MRVGPIGKHARKRAWWWKWWALTAGVIAVGAAAAAGAVALAGHSKVSPAQDVVADQASTQQGYLAQLLSGITVTPASGASSVPLDAQVSVNAAYGFLTSVKVQTVAGIALPGKEDPGTNEWSSTTTLQPSTTYTVSAVIDGTGGVSTRFRSSFTTLTPVSYVTATVFPTPDMTVGVGQPVAIRFDHDIDTAAAQKAVESHFTVAMSDAVPGGWYWFSPHELHFRPKSYWPAHDQVVITGNLAGWNAGNGRWGSGQISDSFSIGDARISYANLESERMVVTLNGATVAAFPISGGRPQYPTMDGDHIVLDREHVVHMVSSTVGIPVNSPNGYDEYVYEDVHISDSGEYVHSAPWSVGSQGFVNVSHGCINLSPGNATTFYDFSHVGDVVEVTGSPRPPVHGDHGVMDWATPWSAWAPATVVQLTSAH